jgi:hypothetical protein
MLETGGEVCARCVMAKPGRKIGSYTTFRTASINNRQTHCPEGHEYTPDNTYYRANGARHCRQCMRDRHKDFRKYLYGLTAEQHAGLLDLQKGVCAICLCPPAPGRVLVVDHDHNSGAIRGLLCADCNTGLGQLMDSPLLLVAAAAYLRKPAPLVAGAPVLIRERPCRVCGKPTRSMRQLNSRRQVYMCRSCWLDFRGGGPRLALDSLDASMA